MDTPPERPWKVVASLAVSVLTGMLMGKFYEPVARGLWELLTFHPTRPVRPMALSMALLLSWLIAIVVCVPLSFVAEGLSDRILAKVAAKCVRVACFIPMVSFVAYYLIIIFRGIELAS